MKSQTLNKNWLKFYQDRATMDYARYVDKRYEPFIKHLLSFNAKSISEEGCAIGTVSKLLNYYQTGLDILGTDINPDLLKIAEKFAGIRTRQQDILNSVRSRKDLRFGHGVLEHFNVDDMRYIIEMQNERSNYVVHYVPTDKYESPSFGDEKLMPVCWWVSTFNPDNWFTFNGGHDLVLTWINE